MARGEGMAGAQTADRMCHEQHVPSRVLTKEARADRETRNEGGGQLGYSVRNYPVVNGKKLDIQSVKLGEAENPVQYR